jgi:hypothetical protein
MKLALFVVAIVVAPEIASACKKLPACTALQPLKSADDAKLDAKDDLVVARSALTLAASSKAKHIAAVTKVLLRQDFNARILAMPDGQRCVMPAILRALATNPDGRKSFVTLATSQMWQEDPNDDAATQRQDILLRASAVMRPPAKEVLAMWEKLAQPDNGWVNVVALVLPENATPEAAGRFEQMLLDRKHDKAERIDWLRGGFIEHRHEPEMLKMASRLLDVKLLVEVRTAVIEAVFVVDNQHYDTCGPPPFAPLAAYSKPARDELRAFAKKVKGEKLDKALAAAVTKTVAELDAIEKK